MWNYELTNKYFENGELFLVVDFSDGSNKFEKVFKLDAYQEDNWFDAAVNAELDRLNSLTTYSELLDTKIANAEVAVNEVELTKNRG